ncbi:Fic family protein [Chitinophaga dinghuensis]|uniref:Fic family protein n=1 Tax=Chitinophaga dinghuensis TaxID=1539050 RepID=A0A327WA82_9BACT|nr:Fic family protein [Chitinophaga dinghuensis]RAJ87515.1 Fic family protein [Chitinophaga dinghuensis]
MDNQIATINELAKRLWELQPIKPEYQERINGKVRLEFNYNSNHIEGNTLTYGETKLLLIFDKTSGNHDLREYEEMKAHDVAFEIIKEMAADKERPLSESIIRNLHEVLLVRPYWRDAVTSSGQPSKKQIQVGTYKSAPNHVLLPNGEIFKYATPEETPALMQELVDWYRKEEDAGELHPIQLAALLHYRFVRIHPFDDGNGRLSRLLMNYSLLRNNYPPVIIKSEDKRNYLFALNQADTGNLDAFVYYIGQQLIWSLELYINGANGDNLEEEADLNKEIELWKRQIVANQSKSIRKNDITIYKLYDGSEIIELFQLFQDEISVFYNLFQNHKVIYSVNEQNPPTLKDLDLQMRNYVRGYENLTNDEDVSDRINEISIKIGLIDYQYNHERLSFIQTGIRFNFQKYHYIVQAHNNVLYERKYNEFITSEERILIVKTAVRDLFERIKVESTK